MAVNRLSLAVRCTREEYMAFYAAYRGDPVWTTVIGAVVLAAAVVLCILDRAVQQHTLLMGLVGAVLTLLSPLILPTVRKGAAGRRYDTSDTIRSAASLTMDDTVLQIKSACVEGSVPFSALTAIEETPEMTALVFGRELTVCIPMRSFTPAELTAFRAILSFYKEEQTA